MDTTKISDIKKNMHVKIITQSGESSGLIKEVLSKRDNPRGVKVLLDNGDTGRITEILSKETTTSKHIIDKHSAKDSTVIDINDDIDLHIKKNGLFNNNKNFIVTTKFFKPAYCKSIKQMLHGIVIFKLQAPELNISIYKINLYLKKYCVDKDLKYRIIKSESR